MILESVIHYFDGCTSAVTTFTMLLRGKENLLPVLSHPLSDAG